ncbi:YVTN repeat-like/Quino protein amine dehydrogenase [Wolfiporia cocos MD-104 SS10]|uniref:YVTN repeat-like/Quino protein amine dehydrogenase n=1 Tax=Wolfiporia cocos (strain MD-104) TaxID=742152 RepID=A0A2H3J8H1_WOLCO|nr:YVTN repeat-like/Quino protein amine dehydrogenase [Wolfiporia cocos MD-104 SS10]
MYRTYANERPSVSLLSPRRPQWDACLRVIRDQGGLVRNVTFSPNGRWIVSGAVDGTARTFDAVSGTTLNTMHGCAEWVAFSPDSQFIVSGPGNIGIKMWSTASGALIKVLRLPENAGRIQELLCIAYSPDGRTVVANEGMLHMWDTDTGEYLQSAVVDEDDHVWSVAYSPNGARIISASWDGPMRIWDSHSLRLRATFTDHTSRNAVFFPDGAKLASSSTDKMIRIWDATSGQCTRTLEGHTDGVSSVAISSKGNLIASGSWDCTVRLWDAESGEALAILEGHYSRVWSIGFSPEGDRLASGSEDCTVRVWDLQAVAKQSNSQLMGHAARVSCVAFSHDGTQLATSANDGSIIIWDSNNQGPSKGSSDGYHGASYPQVTFSPNGMMLAASCTKATSIWSTTSYALIHEIPCTGWVSHLEFSSDSSQLYVHTALFDMILSCKTWEALNFAANAWSVSSAEHNLWLNEENGWIMDRVTQRKLCWLPMVRRPDEDPSELQACHRGLYACGPRSGIVTILDLSNTLAHA